MRAIIAKTQISFSNFQSKANQNYSLLKIVQNKHKLFGTRFFSSAATINNSSNNNNYSRDQAKSLEEEALELSRRRAQAERERRLASNPFMPRKTLLPV